MGKTFNENARVKIPAIIHLTRLGYEYISLHQNSSEIDADTNIFTEQFRKAIGRINNTVLSSDSASKLISEIKLKLLAEDLGEGFFEYLQRGLNGYKLVDFEHPENNLFQVCTELTYKTDDEEFRPDIIPLLNGMPLSFIEVKIPNNRNGLLAERDRIRSRFKNKKHHHFANITQLLVFSNNMEYDSESLVPVEGAFYGTPDYENVSFNCFREEDSRILDHVLPINAGLADFILRDNNLLSIKGTPEFATNCSESSPTNRILTSLFSKERFLFILKYGFAYVKSTDKEGVKHIQKHIMRYPQLFASLAIQKKLDSGVKKGVIWHTQGSGKTALAYYNVKALSDYFQKQGKIAKFYFIVDRLDLLNQAANEFSKRGLKAVSVNSKEKFIENIRQIGSSGNSGEAEINVVNIQKFSEESISRKADYNINVQRVYFLDEAHRSYNPKGSFLANLINSDSDAVLIALTGTPLIGSIKTTAIFGDYIHTYYYNQSIADGYTLKLIREGISTTYKIKIREILEKFEAVKGSIKREEIFARPEYVSCLTDFIAEDFREFRVRENKQLGGMVLCDSSKQAREMFKQLSEKYPEFKCALILHDEDDKTTRKNEQDAFKKGEYDLLIVFNMLLTGFDAPVLKRLYFGRLVKQHSLLQALTRVNRPYLDCRYGYVVDFADIREEFDRTNAAYFSELRGELGDDFEKYRKIFKDEEEIKEEISDIENMLFSYNTDNLEEFTNEINDVSDKSELLKLRKCLASYKDLYNIIRLLGFDELLSSVDIERVKELYNIVSRRIEMMNLKDYLENSHDYSEILNVAFDQIVFEFVRLPKEELVIADKYSALLKRLWNEFSRSRDTKDPEYVSLLSELKRLLSRKNAEEMDADSLRENISLAEELFKRIKRQNDYDERLCGKYLDDAKFMRVHKRLTHLGEDSPCYALAKDEVRLNHLLCSIKDKTDSKLLENSSLLDNEGYFKKDLQRIAITACRENNIDVSSAKVNCLEKCISREYFAERQLGVC